MQSNLYTRSAVLKGIFGTVVLGGVSLLGIGCGGVGGTTALAGTYSSTLTSGNTTYVLVISSNSVGSLSITLTSTSTTTNGYSGSGVLDPDGSLTVVLANGTGGTATIQGVISVLGFTGNITGTLNFSNINAVNIANGTAAPFIGTFTGTIVGQTSSGTATLVVTSPNAMTLTITGTNSGTFSGSISASGVFTLTGTYVINGNSTGVTVNGVLAPVITNTSTSVYGYASVVNVSSSSTIDKLAINLVN